MNAETLVPDCAESAVRHLSYSPVATVQHHLQLGAADLGTRMRLYGVLASALVWVADCELGLADAGPFVDLRPLDTAAGRLLCVFTSRDRASNGHLAEPVPFVDLLEALDEDVAVIIDPVQVGVVLRPSDLELLRTVLAHQRPHFDS